MFGIDFSEILVIFVIALVVLGPERLPKLAATIGRWLGRARSMARQFREQLEQEASRLQHETKGVRDTFDLNAAQRSTPQGQTYPGDGSSYQPPPADGAAAPSPTHSTPADSAAAPTGAQPAPETAAAAAHPGALGEFGLHNAGAPEPPATQPHPSGAGAAPQEPAVAVEAHERRA